MRFFRNLRHQAREWTEQKISKHSGGDQHQSPSDQSHGGPGGRQHNLQPNNLHFERYPIDTKGTKRELTEDSIAGVEELGDVHSASSWIKRDLGFQGQIGNHVILSYGDTLYTDENGSDEFRGMTSDSIALATHDPLVVLDSDLNKYGYPNQGCPVVADYGENMGEDALGITNVVETEPRKGILYFLLNHRPGGINTIKGAGVATVTLTDTFPPRAKIERLAKHWWDGETEPWWGDVGAIRWKGYIYSYGHAKDSPFIYVARVKWDEATKLEAYEYWNGQNWQKERPKTKEWGNDQRVFWMVNQGQVIYSNYFKCFLFVYSDNFWNSRVQVVTAPSPEGPFTTQPVLLYQAKPITEGSTTYAAVPHPYFDHSGKTLVVTFTNHPNTIQAVRVIFK
ncbi:hypothetical protein DV736_g4021, partial [Chaetothyriales sp. CBS 134916]